MNKVLTDNQLRQYVLIRVASATGRYTDRNFNRYELVKKYI